MVRVIIAGILGGAALFVGGAFSHMMLDLESRAIKRLPSESAAANFFREQELRTGMYGFPSPAKNYDQLSAAERKAAEQRLNDAFKSGPAGYVIVAPSGEDLMGSRQLLGELIADVIAAVLAAFIAAHFSTAATFSRRWLLIILIAPVAWLCLTYSFTLWYRFPLAFIQDGLFAALIEWTLAGAVIAAIVRPILHHR